MILNWFKPEKLMFIPDAIFRACTGASKNKLIPDLINMSEDNKTKFQKDVKIYFIFKTVLFL